MNPLRRTLAIRSDVLAGLLLLALLGACAPSADDAYNANEGTPTLKEAYEGAFLVGTALNGWQVTGRAPMEAELAATQFNTITAENAMKWQRVHPEPGVYDFEIADGIVAFGERHGMEIVGHTLVWHSQTPRWVFQDADGNPVGRDTLLARMRDHIFTVVGRYRGRVAGWDVVNEPLNDDGSLRDSPWRRIIGDDYIAKALEFTHEADPEAGLYLNDYSLPNEPKRNGAIKLIRDLQEKGVPVTGIGLQGHYHLDWPPNSRLDSTLSAFASLGIDVMITELDVNVLPTVRWGAEISDTVAWRAEIDPYTEGLPDSMQSVLADRYADLFGAFLEHSDAITRVTFWGVTDASSWKNDWPVPGRTNYPLLFDRKGQPKPAFDAVIEVSRQNR